MPRAYAALVVTMVFWASAFVAIRHLGGDFEPGGLALARQGVALLALLPFVLVRGLKAPAKRDIPAILVIGIAWYAIYHVALNEAEHRIDAGTASMIMQISPIGITVAAIWFLGERTTNRFVIGLVIAFAGVMLISYATSDGGSGDIVGVLLTLLAALTYVIAVTLQKPILSRMPAVDLLFWSTLVAVVVLLPFAGQLAGDTADASTSSIWWVIYLGVFPSAVAFTTYLYALGRLTASVAGLSTYLVPPITVVIAWIALDETPPGLAYVGGVLCLFGVWWARRPARKRIATPSPSGTVAPR